MENNKWGYLVGGLIAGLVLMYVIGQGMPSQVSSEGYTQQEEQNKELVEQFEDLAFNKKDVNAAAALMSDNFKQHNPTVPDGKQGFINGVGEYLLKPNPNLKLTAKRVLVDDNMVMVHKFGKFDNTNVAERGVAVIDVYRVENGKIVEHWDVIQPIPETAANNNTMF